MKICEFIHSTEPKTHINSESFRWSLITMSRTLSGLSIKDQFFVAPIVILPLNCSAISTIFPNITDKLLQDKTGTRLHSNLQSFLLQSPKGLGIQACTTPPGFSHVFLIPLKCFKNHLFKEYKYSQD